jgi:two-component system response regulator NreC
LIRFFSEDGAFPYSKPGISIALGFSGRFAHEDQPVRVVVADDHEVVRKGVCAVLGSRMGIEVCAEASNGEEAVRETVRLRPDMVIMDVTMPVLDGLSATREIKKLMPEIPVLVLSVHDGPEIIRAAKNAGAQGFVRKIEAVAVLLEAVDALSGGQTFFSDGPLDALLMF